MHDKRTLAIDCWRGMDTLMQRCEMMVSVSFVRGHKAQCGSEVRSRLRSLAAPCGGERNTVLLWCHPFALSSPPLLTFRNLWQLMIEITIFVGGLIDLIDWSGRSLTPSSLRRLRVSYARAMSCDFKTLPCRLQ